MINTYSKIRQQRLLESTREFNARGKSVVRCEVCQMAAYACLCAWRPILDSQCEFVVLMHRNEVFKPTNTGRLIEDALPTKTHVFLWSRIDPDPDLVLLLNDPSRSCFIVFPSDESVNQRVVQQIPPSASEKIITFILLDGTWKQSSRMFHLSRWLDQFSVLSLPETLMRSYAVRKSHQENYLSTVEAAGLCLELAGEQVQSAVLLNYFALFNQHYLATRGCYPPEIGELHKSMRRES